MKKTMKTMLAFVVGALCLTGCEQENMIEEVSNARLVTLTAYQEGEDATRTAIDGSTSTQINWSAGDKINYFGGGTGVEYMTLDEGCENTPSGTFSGTVTTGTTDYVLYPFQASATCTAGVITAEVPMTQYAVADSFDPEAALMVGEVNGTAVEFKNVMSYVKVTIPSDMANCKQVSLKAKDAWPTVAGKVNITASTGAWAETTAKEGQAFVRLVPKSPAEKLTAGTSYYIAILPQTMTTGFELIFNDNDVIKVKQSASNSVTFARKTTKKLGDITSFSYTVSATALTSTLKVAECNIGAASSTDYGDYFSWAALRPEYITKTLDSSNVFTDLYKSGGFTAANTPYYIGSAYTKYANSDSKQTLEPEDDIATMLWGGKWRMPTNDELTALKGLESEWISATPCGRRFTGTGGYSSNGVFLPAAGYSLGVNYNNEYNTAGYWSSSWAFESDYDGISSFANGLTFDWNTMFVSPSSRPYGYTVRAVLAEAENPTPDVNPILPGLFTVANDGNGNVKKVKFTKSNLYWDGSAFHFEANPTDYPTTRDASHVGHFFWTNSTDYNSGTATYMPYASTYSFSSQDSSDKFWCGEENKLSVDGVSGLYVLSSVEWDYLIKHRGEGKCKYNVRVGERTNCIIIAPDDYDHINHPLANEYTLAELDAAGLVCLPSAGQFTGSIQGGDNGYYWSSTPYNNDRANCPALFSSSSNMSMGMTLRSAGCCIRTVLNGETQLSAFGIQSDTGYTEENW